MIKKQNLVFWETVPLLSVNEYKSLYTVIGSQYYINQEMITMKGKKCVACSIRQVILIGETKEDFKFDLKGKVFYFIIKSDILI